MPNAIVLKLAAAYRDLMNNLFYVWVGRDKRPVYYDVAETFPELGLADEHYETIRRELMAVLPQQEQMRLYHDVDGGQRLISGNDEKAWRVFFLRVIGDRVKLPADELCPKSVEVMQRIPNLLEAFFSILEPGKSIPSHNGIFYGYLRYHLAFKVPKRNPPSIRIKDTVYTWKEGESVLFDDSWNHEVFNQADETRVVLIIDVMRPMPWPLHFMNKTWPTLKRWIGVGPTDDRFELMKPGKQAGSAQA